MSSEDRIPLRVVLHEGPGSVPLDDERRFEILRALLEKGYPVTSTRAGDGSVAPADSSDILVLREAGDETAGREPSAVAGTGAANGNGQEVSVHFRELSGRDAAGAVELVEEVQAATSTWKNPGWKPWFPVIDYDRCTNCMQCLSFCLFDVYGVDGAGQIEVRNEEKCKTNCPACSRVCPEVAILFPKYGAGPINGAEVQAEDVQREKMKVDISALLGGDIYSMLRDRHRKAESRFAKERDEGKALKERMRCLKKLQESLDVPEEVLQTLPSQDQIMRKAQEKAEEARRAAGEGVESGDGSGPAATT